METRISILIVLQLQLGLKISNLTFLQGIIGNVTLGGLLLQNWKHYRLFANWTLILQELNWKQMASVYDNCRCDSRDTSYTPAFYAGSFESYGEEDLFLDVSGCGSKGVAFVNGHNLGRYWPKMGPQLTLYIPRPYLKQAPALNGLVMLELERDIRDCLVVALTNRHIINGTTPDNYH